MWRLHEVGAKAWTTMSTGAVPLLERHFLPLLLQYWILQVKTFSLGLACRWFISFLKALQGYLVFVVDLMSSSIALLQGGGARCSKSFLPVPFLVGVVLLVVR